MTLREKATKGIGWSAIEQWGRTISSFLVFLIFARLIAPSDFGLIALAHIYIAFIRLFLDQGIGNALVQLPKIDNKYLDSAFWANIFMGSILTTGGILFSVPISKLFGEPILSPILIWLSLSFFLSSFGITQRAILQRNINFRSLAIASISARIVGGFVGISLALSGYGVWSLVAQSLAEDLASVVLLWRINEWRPKFRFSGSHFKHLFKFGLGIVGTKIMKFVDIRLDDFLIGFFLGTTALGYYSIAYRVLTMLIAVTEGTADRVVISTFSRLQDDLKRLRTAFSKISEYVSFMVWPIFGGIFILSNEIVTGLFGAVWEPSIPVLQILVLAGIPLSILFYSEPLSIALGKPALYFKLRVLITLARVGFFLIGVRWGIVGVAYAFAFTNFLIYAPLHIWLANHLININLKSYLQTNLVPIAASTTMIVIIYGIRAMIPSATNLYLQIILYIIIGLSVYYLIIRRKRPENLRMLGEILRQFLQG